MPLDLPICLYKQSHKKTLCDGKIAPIQESRSGASFPHLNKVLETC